MGSGAIRSDSHKGDEKRAKRSVVGVTFLRQDRHVAVPYLTGILTRAAMLPTPFFNGARFNHRRLKYCNPRLPFFSARPIEKCDAGVTITRKLIGGWPDDYRD